MSSDEPQDASDPLRDDEALDEIDLTSRLIIAASQKGSALSHAEVDALLGVDRADEHQRPESP